MIHRALFGRGRFFGVLMSTMRRIPLGWASAGRCVAIPSRK